MKAYWNCEAEELKKNFQVSEEGLLPAQVEAIRREKGENVLQEGKRKSVAAVFAQRKATMPLKKKEQRTGIYKRYTDGARSAMKGAGL